MNDFLDSLKEDLLDRRLLPVPARARRRAGGRRGLRRARRRLLDELERPPRRVHRRPRPAGRRGVAVTPRPRRTQPGGRRDHQRHLQAAHGVRPQPVHPAARRRRAQRPRAPSTSVRRHPSSASELEPSAVRARPRRALRRHDSQDRRTTAKPTHPAKPKVYVHYHVTAQFGVVPPVADGAPPQPAPAEDLQATWRSTNRCPARTTRSSSTSASCCAPARTRVFALTGEAILHGNARPACRAPRSARRSSCRSAERELEVVEADGAARHLRTEAREHRQEHRRRASRPRHAACTRAVEGRDANCAAQARRRCPSCTTRRSGVLVFAGHPARPPRVLARAHTRVTVQLSASK